MHHASIKKQYLTYILYNGTCILRLCILRILDRVATFKVSSNSYDLSSLLLKLLLTEYMRLVANICKKVFQCLQEGGETFVYCAGTEKPYLTYILQNGKCILRLCIIRILDRVLTFKVYSNSYASSSLLLKCFLTAYMCLAANICQKVHLLFARRRRNICLLCQHR